MINWIRKQIKKQPKAKKLALLLMRIFSPIFNLIQFSAFPRYVFFILELMRFKKMGGKAKIMDLYPCLFDKTATTAIDIHYFYQAIWAFKSIKSRGINKHVDIGSDVRFVGMLTAVTHITFIDIRPLDVLLENFTCQKGSILSIPFNDQSVPSLSSLHVLEHIGLGRYGDPMDPRGPEKACKELQRVLAPGGRLYLSVPIGRARVQFNGQRIFEISEILAFFPGLRLMEFSAIDTLGRFMSQVNPSETIISEQGGIDFGLGMFIFQKKGRGK